MRWQLKVSDQNEPVDVELIHTEGGKNFRFLVGGKEVQLNNPKIFAYSIDTDEIEVCLESWNKNKWQAFHNSRSHSVEPISLGGQGAGLEGKILSQMPGRILKVSVKESEKVKAGQALLVIEAMKMENEIRAESDCVVSKIHVSVGDSVESGSNLIELDTLDSE